MYREVIARHRLKHPFVTESGFEFPDPVVSYKSWGRLNPGRNNVVVICHALTGDIHADRWFGGLFGAPGILNPGEQFIICMNVPGSCYGSTGPWSVNPETHRHYREEFPELSIRDMVRFQQMLLNEWDIRGVELVIGGSMGGMQALEFTIMDPRVRFAVPIAAGKHHSPWAIGLSHIQRQAIFSDPKWNGGKYDLNDGPDRGLALARMSAMISYRCPSDFRQKFGRARMEDNDRFQVESYLDYQGKKLTNRFDALSYVHLTRAMDRHDIARGRGSYKSVLRAVRIPVLLIGIDSDLLYPADEQREIAGLLPLGEYGEIQSPYGHDAFLIEFDQINQLVKEHQSTLNSLQPN